jgi:hypothetical protein
MSKKVNSGEEGNNGPVNHKGQQEQNLQKGAPGQSRKSTGKHRKDDSEGAVKNTTKKQQNSI